MLISHNLKPAQPISSYHKLQEIWLFCVLHELLELLDEIDEKNRRRKWIDEFLCFNEAIPSSTVVGFTTLQFQKHDILGSDNTPAFTSKT